MKEHPITPLNNFIGAWIPDDVSICDELIEYHKNTPQRGPGKLGGRVDKTRKNSVDCVLDDPVLLFRYEMQYLQPVVEQYKEKYPYCNEVAPWRTQTYPGIQYYAPGGGFYQWHTERTSSQLPYRDRHLVYMTYLNDVVDGGETEFYHQQLKVKPQKGLTLIWPADWTFMHRGIPSPTQEKYIATGWYSFVEDETVT